MTGWQGNEGGQGGWNQPPYTPQGGDPYRPDPYGYDPGAPGTTPYGPSGGTNPYPTGSFPAPGGYDPYPPDQYGQYDPYQPGGFPSPDFGSPPPPRRSKTPMILGVLAIVIIVGAVVAIVLVNRNSDNPTAGPSETSERQTPRSNDPTPSEPTSSGAPGGREDWQTVDNASDSGLTYQVPPDWNVSDTPRPSGLDVDFTGTAEHGIYDCDGATYIRSFAASGDVQSREGADLDLEKTVTDFAKSFGTSYFKDTAKVDVGTPEETEVGGAQAVRLTAPVTPQVSVPKCEAAKGEVAIVGVLLEEEGKPAGVAMLVVVSDVEGGPDDPKPLPSEVAQDILDSASVG
ncbi:hypothetical protein [Actinophytocola sp.]|uniref:hypothetical protein n=1 Tax=Actinophytocola sp. TaxID=1872138 RepID=UPI003D6B5B3D